jgi:hypothetical protein
MTSHRFDTLLVTLPLSNAALASLRAAFRTVLYRPDAGDAPPHKDDLARAEVWFTKWSGIPKGVELGDTPRLRLVQLTSGEWGVGACGAEGMSGAAMAMQELGGRSGVAGDGVGVEMARAWT